MVKEFPAEKRNNRPADDIGDCPAISENNYLCTRERNHEGPHDAMGVNTDPLMSWTDHLAQELSPRYLDTGRYGS